MLALTARSLHAWVCAVPRSKAGSPISSKHHLQRSWATPLIRSWQEKRSHIFSIMWMNAESVLIVIAAAEAAAHRQPVKAAPITTEKILSYVRCSRAAGWTRLPHMLRRYLAKINRWVIQSPIAVDIASTENCKYNDVGKQSSWLPHRFSRVKDSCKYTEPQIKWFSERSWGCCKIQILQKWPVQKVINSGRKHEKMWFLPLKY